MAQRSYLKYLAVFAVAFALMLAAGPATSWAVPGDPDNDGLPTVDELVIGTDPLIADTDNDGLLDGAEVNILGTNPLDADSDDNGTLDGFEDADSDGFNNSSELAGGSNPLVANAAGQLKIISLADPLPIAPDYLRVSTPKGTPIEVSWLVGPGSDFASYLVQFDADPTFASPVEIAATLSPATPGTNAWKKITHEDRVVYWRVLGVLANGRRSSSEIASFEIAGGPDNVTVQPPAAEWDPAEIPTFSWNAKSFSQFRIFLTSREKLQSAVFDMPKDGTWAAFTIAPTGGGVRTWTPGWRNWKMITQLGKNLLYRVAGRDAAGREAFSEWAELTLDGGATNGAATIPPPLAEARLDNDPDLIPTFTADAGTAPLYRFFFSGNGDFTGAKIIAWPAASWTGTLSYTPTAAEWNALSALGPTIYWTVRGYNLTAKVYTCSDVFTYDVGTGFLSVSGMSATTLNSAEPALPTISFGTTFSAEAYTALDYQVIIAADRQAAGAAVVNPTVPQVETSWTMPAAVAKSVASLETAYPWIIVKGRTTAGNSYFSPAYQVTSSVFLRMPVLNAAGAAVEPTVAYAISWVRSPDDNFADPQVDPPTVLFYELQEATNNLFTASLKSYRVNGVTKSFTHAEVTEEKIFFYRVRAVNSAGHSQWSNVRSKKVVPAAANWTAVYSGNQPCTDGGDNYVIDDEQDNARGKAQIFGTAWIDRVGAGFGARGYNGNYHYITATRPLGGNENADFIPNISKAGIYEVYVGFFATENRDDHVEFFVVSASGNYGPFVVSQRTHLVAGAQLWVSLGKFRFNAGDNGKVHHQFSAYGSGLSEEVDVAAFRYVGP